MGASDAGMSTVEMMVALGLFVLLMSVLASVAILGMRISTGMGTRLENSLQSNQGMSAASKILRTAIRPDQLNSTACQTCSDTAIIRATSTQITFYANLDNRGQGPSLVTLEVLEDPQRRRTAILRQTSTSPEPQPGGGYSFCNPATSSSCVPQQRVLARGLIWPTPSMFTYYDFDGQPIASSSLGNADLPRVSSVDVSITAQTKPGGNAVPTATAVQRVRLPNADIFLPEQLS